MLVFFNQVPMEMAKKNHILGIYSILFLRIYIIFLGTWRVNGSTFDMWRQIWGRPAWPRSASGMSPPAIKEGIWFIPRGLEKSGTWGPLLLLILVDDRSETMYNVQDLADHPNRESWESWRSIWLRLQTWSFLLAKHWVPEKIDGCWLREGWHVAPMNSTRAEDGPSASQSPPIDALMQGGLRQFAGNCRCLHCRGVLLQC